MATTPIHTASEHPPASLARQCVFGLIPGGDIPEHRLVKNYGVQASDSDEYDFHAEEGAVIAFDRFGCEQDGAA